MHKSQAKTPRRGPPGSTIIIFKELIRFNHFTHGPPRFLPTRGSTWRRLPPPLRGGNHGPKSLLLSPYPAIPPYVVRTPHPGVTDDRKLSRPQRLPQTIERTPRHKKSTKREPPRVCTPLPGLTSRRKYGRPKVAEESRCYHDSYETISELLLQE